MLNKILSLSLHNRLLVLITAVLLSCVGLFVARTINVDIFPDLTAPTVTILTEAHGMESEEVEKLVTFQIETALNGSPSMRRVRSSSAAGISVVWVEFDWGTDIFKARQVVNERLGMIRERLPATVGEPTLAPVSSIMGEIMLIGVTSDSLSPMQLRTLADWTILPRLKAVSGIANIIVMGGDYKEYQVQLLPEQMKYYGVSVEEVIKSVKAANVNTGGGFFNQHGNEYIIKGSGRSHSVEDLADAFIKRINGQSVYIRDVARVVIGASDKIGDGSLNAQAAVIMTVSKQPETNTLELTERIDGTLIDLKASLPKGVEVNSHIFRQSNFIEASIRNLNQTLLEGSFFVVLVLFIFLMNWRTTVISLVAIPLSLLVSVIVLKLLGYTLNTMSLGGMAIAIGALVDDAIIDVENVFKRLRENAQKEAAFRRSILQIILDASVEVRSSIIIATFIIIVSFIPLFFLSGMEGRLLQPLGISFITSVLTSLVVAVTVTPVLCSFLLKNPALFLKQAEGTRVERWLQKRYKALLGATLRVPRIVIGLTVAAFAMSLVLFFHLGRNFLPEFNEGSLVISVVGPPGMSLEESNKAGNLVERLLLEMPEITIVTRRTGRAELDEHAQGANASEIDAPFQLKRKSREEFFAEVRRKLSVVPGVNITLGQPIAHRIDHMLSGTRANIAMKIFGPDLSRLFSIGKEVQQAIQNVEGLADVAVEQQIEVPQIRITPRRQLLAAHGLTANDITEFVDVAFAGETVSQIYEGEQQFDIVVRYHPEYRGSLDNIRSALVMLPEGGAVPLAEIADISSVGSAFTISRENIQRKVVVSANVQGRDLVTVVDDIRAQIQSKVKLPQEYHIEYGGQFESEANASQILLITAILSIAIIFLLLYFEFKSAKLAGVVLLNLPLALIGGILVVYFSWGSINIATTIGFISLLGIATRNGILLVSHYQVLHGEGLPLQNVLIQGSADRLIPIVMTALATALALIPLAVKAGEPGNEIQSPMAVVILGGLLTATVLNLLVIPCVYSLLIHKPE